MITRSSISVDAQNYIRTKLSQLEQERQVRILFAVESGSRAWGFPSKDSDYDIRFIFARDEKDYFSVREHRDVIETPIVNDDYLGVPFDMNGWDIRKALRLAINSNPSLIEWFSSPIRYIIHNGTMEQISQFAFTVVNKESLKNHYYQLTKNAWQQIQEKGQDGIGVKLYCYALRPALCLRWIEQLGAYPPMDLWSLLQGLTEDKKLMEEIVKLISLKATVGEHDIIPHLTTIDHYITQALNISITKISKTDEQRDELYKQADLLFRKLTKQ
ncbi:MAG: hypothetical protein K0S74_1030 [Chlamydiales bacterium]|jgi:predicted nucleotidyltransferase|nr:hypothetical protein [Chlamydiales bacterium]